MSVVQIHLALSQIFMEDRMIEKEMRELNIIWPKTEDELLKEMRKILKESNDYGKAVYCMSICATMAFYYAAHIVGATGFQASCADMDILRRTRDMENGFRILNYADLLYPQHKNKFEISFDKMIIENIKIIGPIAKKQLEDNIQAHENVIKHWQYIADLYNKQSEES